MMQDTHSKDYVRESYRYPRAERVDQFLMDSIVIQEYQMNKLFLRSQNAN